MTCPHESASSHVAGRVGIWCFPMTTVKRRITRARHACPSCRYHFLLLFCLVLSCPVYLVLFFFPSPSLLFLSSSQICKVGMMCFFFFPSIRWPNVGAWGDRRPTGRSQPSIELRESFAYSVLGNNNLWAPGLARFGLGLGLGLGLLSICGESERGGARNGMFGWGGWLV